MTKRKNPWELVRRVQTEKKPVDPSTEVIRKLKNKFAAKKLRDCKRVKWQQLSLELEQRGREAQEGEEGEVEEDFQQVLVKVVEGVGD